MARKVSSRGWIKRACGNVVLQQLPQLPDSLRDMILDGRSGKVPRTDMGQFKIWAQDIQAYAATHGLYADVASKHSYLRVNFFIVTPDEPPAIHVSGPRPLQLLGDALEICSDSSTYEIRSPRKPARLKSASRA